MLSVRGLRQLPRILLGSRRAATCREAARAGNDACRRRAWRIPPWAGSMTRCCRPSSAFPTPSSRGCCSTSSPTRWSTRDDTRFNESFAVAVEEEGCAAGWGHRGAKPSSPPSRPRRRRRELAARVEGGMRLEAVYKSDVPVEDKKRVPKSSASCAPNTARSCPPSRTTPSSSRSRCTPSSCRRSSGCWRKRRSSGLLRAPLAGGARGAGGTEGPRRTRELRLRFLHESAMSTVFGRPGARRAARTRLAGAAAPDARAAAASRGARGSRAECRRPSARFRRDSAARPDALGDLQELGADLARLDGAGSRFSGGVRTSGQKIGRWNSFWNV